jgi:ATP/maltotriose-dependent transcriptional regulator MalT
VSLVRRRRPLAPGTRSCGRLPATIAAYRATIAQARGDVDGTVAHARHALELAGPDDHFARGAGDRPSPVRVVNTLRTHTKHIFTKLDVNTRRAAVGRGTELGLL